MHNITNAVQLQAFILERVGVMVTVQTFRALLRKTPSAPRAEMIQLLCDALGCPSEAFYVFTPNPARARQWIKDRAEGKKPSRQYEPKAVEPAEETAEVLQLPAQRNSMEKPKTPRAIFTDPRKFYKDR